ncbi:MAG: DUF1311 domain-containing protein [Synergistaceae bacterium]|nr:DUF1311 domain-containing protein [Synergistaceae bacterium]
MKRFVTVMALMFLMISPALGLSDTEYLRMRRSNVDFARADRKLNQVWTNLKRSLPKKIFTQLDKLQREWVKSGRDEEAAALMDEGYSRMEAYTIATNDRAKSLPEIADELRDNNRKQSSPRKTQSQRDKPKPQPKPEPQPEPEPEPEPEPTPEPEPEPRPTPEPVPEEPVNLKPSEIAGEYQSPEGFVSVRIVDINTDEAEVTFSRYKDGVHWTARGWIDGNTLELSDSNYSNCQATLTFSRGSVKVEISETDDWSDATSPDFVFANVYRKSSM